MPLDSLGLGLTLDTTLLEKADKTLENMHKNSKLVMQNLTRGITAFNEGKISDFSRVFDEMAKSMDKLSKTTVSPDFDTKGLEKGIGYVTELTAEIEKMQRAGTKEFFNPENLYTTTKSLTEATLLLKYFRTEAKKVGDAIKTFLFNPIQISEAENNIKSLKASLKGLSTDDEAYAETTIALKQEEDRLKDLEKELEDAKKAYGDLDSARLKSKEIIEQTSKAEQLVSWSSKTKAEQLAAITSYNNKIIADERARTKEVETLYKNNFAEMQRISKSIVQLEADREKIAKGGGDTTEQDINLAFYRDQLQKRIELEEEITKSGYQKIAKIKEELNAKSFLDTSKQQVKNLQTDLAYANQFSKSAKNINEEKEAIKLLTAARDNLSNSTAHYDQVVNALNKRIAKHEDHVKLLTQEQKESKELQDSVISRYIREKKEIKELNKLLKELHEKQASTGIKTTEEDKYEQDIIARRQRLWNDVHQIEVDNAKQIAQLKEKYDASVAEEKIQEIIKTNEKEKQEYAKLLDDLYALEKQKKAMEAAGGGFGDKAYMELIKQETDLTTRKNQLEMQHQNDLDEIRKKHNKKRNDDEVKAFIDAQKEKQKIAEETQKKIDAYNEKYGTVSKRGAEMAIESYKGAQNIAQHKQAIEDLQKVRAKLDNTDSQYFLTLKKIDKALKEHHKALRDAGVESNNLMQTHRGLMNIGGQLARRLALAFSVSQLTQYFRKLVEVRGQFEKTEVALTSIIGDNQKAQKLMNQTIALAVQSPFTLQQLTGYTKQLAAYQVSYEELHSTTKMLADVSAGLGVEMDRLILAFGQVKAANYLRATEVRQFTEAGFNILGELAKYYSELEGRMISVGDVQERVTKRMVDFGDVEEIFRRVTSAGGMFFDMQSKQAETLAGQWTNLQDRIDIMLNEIGSDKEGLLKGLVRMLASLIDNWEALADVIKMVVGAFVLYKVNLLAVTKAQVANSIAAKVLIKDEIRMLGLTKGLASAWKGLGFSVNFANGAMKKFFVANAWLLALTAIAAAIASVISHFNKLNDAVDENTKAFSANRSEAKKLAEEYGELNAALAETVDREEALAIIEKKRLKLQELAVKLKERGLKLTNEEGEVVDTEKVDAALLDDLFASNQTILDNAYTLGEELSEAITRGANAAQGTVFGFSFFGENLQEDAEDLGETYGKIASHTFENYMKDVEANIHNNFDELSTLSQEQYKELAEGRKAERDDEGKVTKWLESEYGWTKRRLTLLQEIAFRENEILGVQLKLNNARANLTNAEYEFSHELDGVLNKLIEKYGSIEALKEEYKKNPEVISAAIKTEVDKTSWNENVKWFAEQDLHAKLKIDYNYVEVVSTTPPQKVYEGFKKDLIDARKNLEDKGEGYSNFFISTEDIDKMAQFTDGLEGIQKAYDENIKKREQLKDTTTEEGKAELTMVNALIAEIERLAAAWGYTLNVKGKDGSNEALKRLKDQIQLIKEANKAYEERNKKFGKTDSQAVVTDAYKDAFKELGLDIEKIDYTNLEGVVKALEDLEKKAKEAGGETEWLKEIAEVKAEIGLTLKERQDKELFSQVQEIFDDYELAVDIKKLNLSPELAKNLFGVDTKSFDQMRTEIISKFAGTNEEVTKILSKGYEVSAEDEKILIEAIGKDRVDKAKEALEKIQDLEDKAQLERLKKYVEYAKKGVTERAKIKLEEMRQLEEIQKTFEAKDEDSADVKAQKQDMANRASEKVRKETQDALNRLDWGEFEKSNIFIRVFDDLDSASTSLLSHLITKIQGFKDEWTDMPLEDVEKIIEALNKLQTKLAEANPWKEFTKAKKDFEEAKKAVKFEDAEADALSKKRGTGNYLAALDKEEIAQQKVLEDANKQIAALEVQLATQEKIVATTEEEKTAKAEAIAKTTKELDAQKGIKTAAEGNLKAIQKTRSEHSRIKASLAAQYQTTSKCFDMASQLGAAISDMVKTLAEDDPAAVFADMAVNMLSTVANTLALQAQLIAAQGAATGLGAAMNTAAGVIGWIVMAIQLLVQAISAAVNYADKLRQMKLDVLAGQVDVLKQKFDELAESIEKAWAYRELQKYEKELDKVQQKMISTQKAYIKLLESGKDGDTIDIAKNAQELLDAGYDVEDLTKKQQKALLSEEYQNYKDAVEALAEIEEDYAAQKQEILESVGGITDPQDAASEFVDAWLDAYKETGDGLKGLEENFDEFFENLIKQKAARMLSDTLLKDWIDTVNGALAEDSAGGRDLTDSEMADIKAAQERAKGQMNDLLLNLFEGLGVGKEGGSLSELQKGIQGITEDTAQIIEAYLNSIRGMVSEQVTYTKRLYEMFYRMSSGETYGLNVRMIS